MRIFLEAFISDVEGCKGVADELQKRWAENEYSSQSSVMLMRLLTSAYLRIHADEYYAFVDDQAESMQSFCQQNVECIGVESEELHMVAICNAFRSRVHIHCMSGSQKTLANEDSVVIGDEGACDPVLADL